MAIAYEEEDPLVVVFQPIKNATWDLVPIEPVGHKMNQNLKLIFHINIILIPNEDNLLGDILFQFRYWNLLRVCTQF